MEVEQTKLGLDAKGKVKTFEGRNQKDSNDLTSKARRTEQALEAVTIGIENNPSPTSVKFRDELNRSISSINLLSESAQRAEDLIKGLEGIVEQFQVSNSEKKQELLVGEAVELIKNIKSIPPDFHAQLAARPSEVEIRSRLEKELGRTLEILLPESLGEAFGNVQFSVSRKEFILNTQAAVAVSKQRIERLRQALQENREKAGLAVSSFEVAKQNIEASNSSIRDLDQALRVSKETSTEIGNDPLHALASIRRFTTQAATLLE